MCIIAWHWDPVSDIPLIILANRDEFYNRPALSMHWWHQPSILAGKDLQAHGAWLAINQKGNFAGITNYRNTQQSINSERSRGDLIPQFFASNLSVKDYLDKLKSISHFYQNFNLILFDGENFTGFESLNNNTISFEPGTHVVSNGSFHCNWPKSLQLKENLVQLVHSKHINIDVLSKLLKNKNTYPLDSLPNTGLNIKMEEILSSIFIQSESYGTRVSSIYIKYKTCSIICEITYNNSEIVLRSIYSFENY